ncbi:hypothetical protein LOCC1_G002839 [Lachnellula occidentalis]|uniref:Uncharacterized protein n=1 Tax=Lachnellula occidentalis TaxID=215460 RepID=A0A8H8S4L0_9HELO|nr:hypothetical protein LOCC1_G002839 [Lachnellula occidentalis]
MAPISAITSLLPRAAELVARRTCYNNNYYSGYNSGYGNGGSYNCNSAWSRWGRWVLAGILIFIAIVFILLFALRPSVLCPLLTTPQPSFCARRRRRRSAKTYENTAMTNVQQPTGNNYQNDQPMYAPPAEAPPLYSGNYGGGGSNQGYYGQQGGVTQPQGAYVK